MPARRVKWYLSKNLKEPRVDVCQELSRRFEAEGVDFLARTVAGDESWLQCIPIFRPLQEMKGGMSLRSEEEVHESLCTRSKDFFFF